MDHVLFILDPKICTAVVSQLQEKKITSQKYDVIYWPPLLLYPHFPLCYSTDRRKLSVEIYRINVIGISFNGPARIFYIQLHRWLVLTPYRLVSTVRSNSKITRNCKTLTKSTASVCRQWKLNTVRNGYFSGESNKMTSNWCTKNIILIKNIHFKSRAACYVPKTRHINKI